MDIVEISTKSALVRSRIPGVEYAINPYLGCEHGCRFCYAVFMRKYSHGHQSTPWGRFVEAKINIAAVLRQELSRKRSTGRAMLSSVCDPYQPAETRYNLTRQCLEVLKEFGWGIDILTRSPLVLRDLDFLKTTFDTSIGFSIGTDKDEVRAELEPGAPTIGSRIAALKELHAAGLKTWVFIAPLLPMDPENLCRLIAPHVDHVLIDPLNYREQVTSVFTHKGWQHALTDEYAEKTRDIIVRLLGSKATLA